ncbi:MAG: cytochrome b N-terminal domain-containing protein [Anaerolineales bacterium]
MKRWLETRLSIVPVLDAIEASQPPDHVSLREAPPFSLGRMTLLLVAILFLSGFGLLLFYEPTAEGAAASLAFLHVDRPLGWLIHNAHRWSALLLVAAVVLHALRALLARAYLSPRDLNWWMGLALLLLVIAMGATGYMLRWEIKAFALLDLVVTYFSELPVIGRSIVHAMLGGTELDRVPLYRGYAFHVWVLPLLLVTGISLHLLVAWRQGLAEQPHWWQRWKARLPDFRWLDLLPGAALLALVLLVAALTPHEGQAGPTDRSLLPHPDWILGFYVLPFWYFDKSARVLGAVIIPVSLLTLLIFIPRIAREKARRWILTALAAFALVGVAWLFGQIAFLGYQIPSQGCTACHQPGILGGAPTTLSEFKIRDPDWLIFHLREPEESILSPSTPAEPLP